MNQEVDLRMKRVLLLGFILAICILAFPQGVLAAPTAQPVIINANYGTETSFSVSTDGGTGTTLNMGTLIAGQDNTIDPALYFNVKSQSIWTVTGRDSTAQGKDGYMKGSQGFLNNALKMTTKEDANWHDFTGTSLTVNHGTPSASAVPWTTALNQHVDDSDFGSSTPFGIQLTFDCSTTF
jgi:hypothetical protein